MCNICTFKYLLCYSVHMMNDMTVIRTNNSSGCVKETITSPDWKFSYLAEKEAKFTVGLLQQWKANLVHLKLNKQNSAQTHLDNLERLIRSLRLAPWKFNPSSILEYFENRTANGGKDLKPGTYAQLFSSWRSFQSFMLELEVSNRIQKEFGIRPQQFIDETNSVALRRKKRDDNKDKKWALSPEQIDKVDAIFQAKIVQAYHSGSKSFLPLIRDRVMFHITIHFALRVHELVKLQISDFREHPDPHHSIFGRWGLLKITGKGSVTGSVPMREKTFSDLLDFYFAKIRPQIMQRASENCSDFGAKAREIDVNPNDLLFMSERGDMIDPNAFRKRLNELSLEASLPQRMTPHILRHTGCTLMVPLYSAEEAQKYMRHKHLATTLGYYHSGVYTAGNSSNDVMSLFGDDED